MTCLHHQEYWQRRGKEIANHSEFSMRLEPRLLVGMLELDFPQLSFNFGSVQSILVGPSAPISNAMTGAVLNFMSNSNGACESPTFCALQKSPSYGLHVVLNFQMLVE